MVLRQMTPSDYKNFTIGQVLDIIIGASELENQGNKNGNETQYVTDERSVDKIMGF
jgi:hypothetical protein